MCDAVVQSALIEAQCSQIHSSSKGEGLPALCVNPQRALEPNLEGPEGVDYCHNSGILNCLRSH